MCFFLSVGQNHPELNTEDIVLEDLIARVQTSKKPKTIGTGLLLCIPPGYFIHFVHETAIFIMLVCMCI